MTFQLRPAARPLFHRHAGNPIITAGQLPYAANAVFNPGAALVDGETSSWCGSRTCAGISHLQVARSANGIDGWRFDPEPLMSPDPDAIPRRSGAARIPA